MALLALPTRRIWKRLMMSCPESLSGITTARDDQAFVCRYDREGDLLFARFGDPVDADTIAVEPDITVRISRATRQPVAIEVVDCAARFARHPDSINAVFARELLARYGRKALERLVAANERRPALV